MSILKSVIKSIVNRELIIPHLEMSLTSGNWPESYQITVDSTPYAGRGDGWFHPSSHPLLADRVLYYLLHPDHKDKMVREKSNLQKEMTFAMGSAIHAVVQTQLEMAGLCRPEDIEVPILNEEHHYKGNMDFRVVLPDIGTIGCELKTMNSRQFSFLQEPKPEWRAQLNLYMHHLGLQEGVVIVVESGFPYSMREFRINRDEALLEEIFDKFDRVLHAIETNTPPRFCCDYLSEQMKKCPARAECWLSIQPE